MSHLDEEALVLYYYREGDALESAQAHLQECATCRGKLEAIELDLRDVGAIPAPERSGDYGAEVWSAVAPQLGRRHSRNAWLLAAAALVLASTFLAGRLSTRVGSDVPEATVRERILLVALGDHLERSEVLLLELANTDDRELGQETAQELLRESRLYRQTAYQVGDVAAGDLLDELERLLLDVAHGATPNDTLKSRIQEQDVLFKIRVLQTNVRTRGELLAPQKF